MLVRDRMTQNPITIIPDISVTEALRLMSEKKIRRLPVVDRSGQLVGIVSDRDLLQASPSPATSLAIWEIHDLLAKLTVEKCMAKDVITVSEDTPLEEAARIMVDRRIGGLPVVNAGKLVGIITESDLFNILLELLGGRRQGVRLTVATTGAKGTLADVTKTIYEAGGNIVGLGFSEVDGDKADTWVNTFKVQGVPKEKLVEAIRPHVREIMDVRETS
ncbi:CBS and ACT domain-containing protein [Geomonas subterranea]|uniref:CBS and ACT domain-containing protein n=1 Tax=Geomonas subterranea TaxID=2847989 RepID=A0ABX8LEC5_9BACT|nr:MULTISPECIES: CBS and ACT domain-containing protein [Geomonas]QXE89069.1 CBS and ACT domain-containing protein [Geomonas subterranea]QXM08813.1 CBS and ACT domain-containing protein [Geomonas subterranea]